MMLTLAEVAQDLRVSERAVRTLIKAGSLEAIKVGIGVSSPYRISQEALAKYKQGAASELAAS
jgi:excisionase family DNA binding protein